MITSLLKRTSRIVTNSKTLFCYFHQTHYSTSTQFSKPPTVDDVERDTYLTRLIKLKRYNKAIAAFQLRRQKLIPISRELHSYLFMGLLQDGNFYKLVEALSTLKPSMRILINVITKWIKRKDFDAAISLVKAISTSKIAVKRNDAINIITFNRWLTSMSDDIGSTLSMLEAMKEHGQQPDIVTYRILMRTFLNAGLYVDALGVKEKIIEEGMELTEIDYTILLKWCCEPTVERFDEAVKLLEEMCERNIKLTDLIQLTRVLRYYSLPARQVEKAIQIFRDVSSTILACKPDLRLYTTLISGLLLTSGDKKKCEEVKTLYKEMMEWKINPDAQLYDLMINEFIKEGELDFAAELLTRMRRERCELVREETKQAVAATLGEHKIYNF